MMSKRRVVLGAALVGSVFALWLAAVGPRSFAGSASSAHVQKPDPTSVRSAKLARADGVCRHPYVPGTAGFVERFRATRVDRGVEVASTFDLSVERVKPISAGVQVEWRVVAKGISPSTGSHSMTLTRLCMNSQAEDPWFGGIFGSDESEVRGKRWLWPAELATGALIEGSLGLESKHLSIAVSRQHQVQSFEDVTVGAGTFKAVRISFVENSVVQGEKYPSTGTVWLAPRVGLVKLISKDRDIETRQELEFYEFSGDQL